MKKLLIILISFLSSSFTIQDSGTNFYNYCKTYGRDIAPVYKYGKTDCTNFLDKSLKKFYRIDNKELTKIIMIDYSINQVDSMIRVKNKTILTGVCYGLVKFGYAEWVDIKNIRKGDIVQYWSTLGYTNGHCGIFHGYDKKGNVLLTGSHPDSNGYGIMNCYNKGNENNIYFFVVRLIK